MKFKRIFLVVCDSLGVGEAINASDYGDSGANTLGHIIEKTDLFIPNLKKLGFVNTLTMSGNGETEAYYTIAKPINNGKDTLTGHYEIMGLKVEHPFVSFTETGFPQELIRELEQRTGRKVLGNKAASGTVIIDELGEESMRCGGIIVYTSADSVLQIAAHEDIVPLPELYKICEIAREITTKPEWKVGRVIARPFIGKPGKFKRTTNRHDYTLKPDRPTVLNFLAEQQLNVISIGKIFDIFAGEGINKKVTSGTNREGIDKLLDIMDKNFTGLCFANLNDFDTLYGHRRDVEGYANAIEELDVEIPIIMNKLNNDDLLIITADHGNDPTFRGTDHTKENVPVILYSRVFKEPKMLPAFNTFADIGATIADNFGVRKPEIGESVLDKLI
jgi:phosphopentomutase